MKVEGISQKIERKKENNLQFFSISPRIGLVLLVMIRLFCS